MTPPVSKPIDRSQRPWNGKAVLLWEIPMNKTALLALLLALGCQAEILGPTELGTNSDPVVPSTTSDPNPNPTDTGTSNPPGADDPCIAPLELEDASILETGEYLRLCFRSNGDLEGAWYFIQPNDEDWCLFSWAIEQASPINSPDLFDYGFELIWENLPPDPVPPTVGCTDALIAAMASAPPEDGFGITPGKDLWVAYDFLYADLSSELAWRPINTPYYGYPDPYAVQMTEFANGDWSIAFTR